MKFNNPREMFEWYFSNMFGFTPEWATQTEETKEIWTERFNSSRETPKKEIDAPSSY